MHGLSPGEIAALLGGGLVAGVVNTLAGGGSLLSVPLLVLLGLPGTVANGTNRIGVLLQSLVATWRFRGKGLLELRPLLPVLLPVLAGSLARAPPLARRRLPRRTLRHRARGRRQLRAPLRRAHAGAARADAPAHARERPGTG